MMAKYQRFESCLESPVYQAIIKTATEDLLARGVFSQAEVLDKTDLSVVEDSIRWDYVERMLEEMHHTELVWLRESYFKRHPKQEEQTIPGRYIAVNRKQTIGYAIASLQNGHLVKHVLMKKQHVALGHLQSAARTQAIGTRVGIPDLVPPQIAGNKK